MRTKLVMRVKEAEVDHDDGIEHDSTYFHVAIRGGNTLKQVMYHRVESTVSLVKKRTAFSSRCPLWDFAKNEKHNNEELTNSIKTQASPTIC